MDLSKRARVLDQQQLSRARCAPDHSAGADQTGEGKNMSHLANVITSNRILGALQADDLDFMHPHLEPVSLCHGDALVLPDRQIEFVYFIEKGLASTIAESTPEAPVEVGMAGCEGLVGIPVVLGSGRAPYRVVVQGPGDALRVAAEDLKRIV